MMQESANTYVPLISSIISLVSVSIAFYLPPPRRNSTSRACSISHNRFSNDHAAGVIEP